jgi:hypothetical protein
MNGHSSMVSMVTRRSGMSISPVAYVSACSPPALGRLGGSFWLSRPCAKVAIRWNKCSSTVYLFNCSGGAVLFKPFARAQTTHMEMNCCSSMPSWDPYR